MRFKDKVAFITGGGRGIGETYARALSAEGAAVVLAEIDLPAAKASPRVSPTAADARWRWPATWRMKIQLMRRWRARSSISAASTF